MDVSAMLEKCLREQWRVGDLDWSGRPRPMSRDDEIAIVQYFTDMAGIERLAAALFAEQEKKSDSVELTEIFRSFVKDEIRHAHAAEMLAEYYDVHRYRAYRINPALVRFTPHFINAISHLSAEIANAYITSGELILDIALLRSINDHVGDEMSERAMALINRDESRHIAVDFHMIEYYSSKAYADRLRAEPKKTLADHVKAAWALGNVLFHAAPFFKGVFFEPMRVVDPSGRRLKEAFKRIQLLGAKDSVKRNGFIRVMLTLQTVYNDYPRVRRVFGTVIERIIGVEPAMIFRLYTEAERRRAEQMSFDDLALDALAQKYVH